MAESARAVSELGRELHSRLVKLWTLLSTLGTRLNGTVRAFNETVGSYEARVLPGARRFADEHQLRPRIAHAENDLLASLFGQAAAGAVADVFADGAQPLGWIDKAGLGHGGNFDELRCGSRDYGFGSGQWVSLFWLNLDSGLAPVEIPPVKIIDAEFIVVADAIGQSAFELWVQEWGHGISKQLPDFRLMISD